MRGPSWVSKPACLFFIYLFTACQPPVEAANRPWVGVSIEEVGSNDVLVKFGWSSGVVVEFLYANSPASSAGIMGGDIIVELDGNPIENATALICLIALRSPGNAVRLTTIRGAEVRHVSIELGHWPDNVFPNSRNCPEYIG
jgi:S1-C subfamily serine protease